MKIYQMEGNMVARSLGSDSSNGMNVLDDGTRAGILRRLWRTICGVASLHKSKFYYADVLAAICFLIAVVFSCLNQSWNLLYMALAALGISFFLYIMECVFLYYYKQRYYTRISGSQKKIAVIRGGNEAEISARALQVGDLIVLREGTILYGDVRILTAENLYADENLVFGSTIPSRKTAEPLEENYLPAEQQSNMLWMGSYITSGSGRAVVVSLCEDCYVEKTGGRNGKKQRSFFYNRQNNIGHISSYVYIILASIGLLIAVIATNRYVEAFLLMAAMLSVIMLNPASYLIEWTYYRTAEQLFHKGTLIRNVEAFDGMNKEKSLYYSANDFIKDQLKFTQVIPYQGSEKSCLSYFSLCVGPGYLNDILSATLTRHQLSYERLGRNFPVFQRQQDEGGTHFGIFSHQGFSAVSATGYWQRMLPYLTHLDDAVLQQIQELEYHGKMVYILASARVGVIPSTLDCAGFAGKMELMALFVFQIPTRADWLSVINQLRRAAMKVYLVSDYTETLGKSIAATYDMDGVLRAPPEHPCYTLPALKNNPLIAYDNASPIEKERANIVIGTDIQPQQVIYQCKCMFCGLRRCLNFISLFGVLMIFTILTLFLQGVSLEKIIFPVLLMKGVVVFPCYYLIESVGNCNQYRRSLLLGALCGGAGFFAALFQSDAAMLALGLSCVWLSLMLLLTSRKFRAIQKKDGLIFISALLLAIVPWIFLGGNWLVALILSAFPPVIAYIVNLFY